MTDQRPSPAPHPVRLDVGALVVLLFFVSGGAALIYQVALIRVFVELYGSTAGALGAVVGGFLVALALGALLLARPADRAARPLRWYAKLELVAAAGGLVLSFLPRRLESVVDGLGLETGTSSEVVRWLLALAVMLVPIGALGGTLPVLARLRSTQHRRGRAAGGLQFASTSGAVVGALGAALWTVPALGLSGSLRFAALLNALIGVLAWILSGRGAPSAAAAPTAAPREAGSDAPVVAALPFLIPAFLTGVYVVGLEVLLFRGLAQIARGSLDSLAVLLAAFLAAQALGTAVGTWWSRWWPLRGFVAGQALAVVGAAFGLLLLYGIAGGQATWLEQGRQAETFAGRLLGEALASLAVAGPAGFCAALAFPCVCQLRPRRPAGFGAWVALQTGLWTLGAAVGGVGAPLLLPIVGLRGGVLACASLPALALLLAMAGERRLRRPGPLVIGAAGVVAGLLLLSLPTAAGSALRDPLQFYRAGIGAPAQLLAYGEGRSANVAVVGLPTGERILKVNNHFSLGGTGASQLEVIQAMLPTLLADNPQRALVLGVGAGRTVGALRELGVPRIDAVELLPLVMKSLVLFEDENGGVLRHTGEGIQLVLDDARTFVRAAEPASYDLIIGDLFFPWQAEAGFLYTREHFARIRQLLRPGGVFCQWLPGHQLRWEELGSIGRSFADSFSGATVWLGDLEFRYPILALIAGQERLEIDVPVLQARLEQHPRPELLERYRLQDAKRLLARYVGDEFFFRDKFAETVVNTIDRPWVEFQAARRIEPEDIVAVLNRQNLYKEREDVVGVMSTIGLEPKERAVLARDLNRVADLEWELFYAGTLRIHAAAYRQLPAEVRPSDPEELELAAFQRVALALQAQPDHARALEMVMAQLKNRISLRQYPHVEQATTDLLGIENLAQPQRLHNLRGMALLLAGCDAKGPFQTDLIDRAVADFRQALEQDENLIEARLHLGISLFLAGADDESLAQLRECRSRIVAPERQGGIGLPLAAEAIYRFLVGAPEEAQQLLRQAPQHLPYLPLVQARVGGGGG